MKKIIKQPPKSEIILYTTPDGKVQISVLFGDETAWMTQEQISQLFQTDRTSVTKHLNNIYRDGELLKSATSAKFAQVQFEGIRKIIRHILYYNLDAIISVGYRVNSAKATQFRIWATKTLKEFIIKGFALDDERLKQGGSKSRYFEELLQRIRDIRSSERNLYQKVTDIYATSIDYRKDDEVTKMFFATVQNKMHYAVHGQTAAEIIANRADSKKPRMGLTSFGGNYITSNDIKIAKNYLNEKELKQLNLIVSLYLDFAELQAVNQRPMRMVDWIKKLDEFLTLSERKLLIHAGKISAKEADDKAMKEFEKYKKIRDSCYISDFDREVKKYLRHSRIHKQKI